MIHEICALLTAHLREGPWGVNALRLSVPLGPTDLPIEEVTIVSEFEVPYLPGLRVPKEAFADGPLVLVRRADDVGEYSAPSAPDIMAADSRVGVDLVVFFPRRAVRALHQENQCLSALLRVVRRSLEHWLVHVPYAERTLRDVQIVGTLAPPRVVPSGVAIGEGDVVAGAIKLELDVTDRWAEITTS